MPSLALYHYATCFYCVRVRRVIDELGLEVELRDIRNVPGYRAELIEVRGRQTVPVLRIEEDGEVRWMPESRDIVRYLHELVGSKPRGLSVPPLGLILFAGAAALFAARYLF